MHVGRRRYGKRIQDNGEGRAGARGRERINGGKEKAAGGLLEFL